MMSFLTVVLNPVISHLISYVPGFNEGNLATPLGLVTRSILATTMSGDVMVTVTPPSGTPSLSTTVTVICPVWPIWPNPNETARKARARTAKHFFISTSLKNMALEIFVLPLENR